MTINISAYSTTACQGHVLTKIDEKLQVAAVNGDLVQLPESNDRLLGLASAQGGAMDVPAFWHPYIFLRRGDKEKCIVLDDRQFVRYSASDHKRSVSNATEYAIHVRRARINNVLLKRNAAYLRDLSSVPAIAYVNWVTESIQRVLALEPAEQMKLSILVAIFYYSQFESAIQLDEHGWNKLAVRVATITRTKAAEVFEIIDILERRLIGNLTEFCNVAESAVGSVRLKELNPGLVFGCTGGGWFGTNVREILGVALEHMPTWFAIVLTAITNRSYHRTTIANVVNRQKRHDLDQYVHAIDHLVTNVERESDGDSTYPAL